MVASDAAITTTNDAGDTAVMITEARSTINITFRWRGSFTRSAPSMISKRMSSGLPNWYMASVCSCCVLYPKDVFGPRFVQSIGALPNQTFRHSNRRTVYVIPFPTLAGFIVAVLVVVVLWYAVRKLMYS